MALSGVRFFVRCRRGIRSGVVASLLAMASGPVLADGVGYRGAVRKVFKEHCVACHNPNRARAELDLSNYDAILAGSASGEVVIEGDPADSFLYLVVAHEEEPVMPPGGDRIPDEDLELLRRWIEDGLHDEAPRGGGGVKRTTDASIDPPTMPAAVEPVTVAPQRRGPIVSLAVDDGRRWLAVTDQLRVLLYDASRLEPVAVLPFPEGEPQTLRFAHGGEYLVAGGGVHAQSGRVVIWSTDPLARVWEGGHEYDAVLAADLSPDGSRVVIGGPSRLVKVLSTATGDEIHRLEKATDWVLDACFSPDGLLFAAGDRDGGVYVWESESGQLLHSLRGHKGAVRRVAWQDGGDVCVSASEDGSVRRWNMHTGALVDSWTADAEGVLDSVCLADGPVATASRGAGVRLWSPGRGPLRFDNKTSFTPTAIAAATRDELFVGGIGGEVVRIGGEGSTVTEITPPAVGALEVLASLVSPLGDERHFASATPTHGVTIAGARSAELEPNGMPGHLLSRLQASQDEAVSIAASIERLDAAVDELQVQLRSHRARLAEDAVLVAEFADDVRGQIAGSSLRDRLELIQASLNELARDIEATGFDSDHDRHAIRQATTLCEVASAVLARHLQLGLEE